MFLEVFMFIFVLFVVVLLLIYAAGPILTFLATLVFIIVKGIAVVVIAVASIFRRN